ncbi:MAG TPA: hypothetical protein VIF09_16775 [Polyangiaceae bacterium]|jgi:hypothetical protein
MVSRAHASLGLLLTMGLCAGAAACSDAVHDSAVAALGPEGSVPPGPQHRPGQPCITCHGGSGPASLQLSLGGTVYVTQGGSDPAVGAVVQVEDIDGKVWTVKTNSAGNFFVALRDFAPHYPILPTVTSADGTVTQPMLTLDNRDGSCADCHTNPAGPTSAGAVYLDLAPLDGGPG